ncbi:MAG: hypothetical protein AB1646_13810 [Thermodesulfobacteriota bacterium]
MKIGLVLTNDWELRGDGSGDYFRLQHRPLEAFMAVAEDHGARLTLMAEVGQQWAHMELARSRGWASEIVHAYEEILRHAVKRGHDVQLHLHPTWLGAHHDGRKWILDYRKWALPSLSADEIRRVLKDGKRYLERVLRPVDANYRCVAFRAGAYCIEPSREVVSALVEAGFLFDTSVVPGAVFSGQYDFREVHSNCLPWFVDPECIRRSHGQAAGLLELPICTARMWDSALLRRGIGLQYGAWMSRQDRGWFGAKRAYCDQTYPVNHRPMSRRPASRTLGGWARAALWRRTVPLDYDNLAPEAFLRVIETALRQERRVRSAQDRPAFPVIATGHLKSVQNLDNIHRILDLVRARLKEHLTYWTIREAGQHCAGQWATPRGATRSRTHPH